MSNPSETIFDHMNGWKESGRSGVGLRRLMLRMYLQRGLESYAAYSLDAAASRIDQLEESLRNAGIEIPQPAELPQLDAAQALLNAVNTLNYTDGDVSTFLWWKYGDAGKEAFALKIEDAENAKQAAAASRKAIWQTQLNEILEPVKLQLKDFEDPAGDLMDYFRQINGVPQEKGTLEHRDTSNVALWGWYWIPNGKGGL